MRWRPLSAALFCWLCSTYQASADAGPPERPIALRDALRLGAFRGPGVALANAPRESVATLGKRASGVVRPPVLTLGGGYRSGALTPGAEVSVSLAQEVPLAGVGSARSEFAKSYARSVETDVKRARLEGATRAAMAWVDSLYAGELLRLRHEGLSQAGAIVKVTISRVEAGVAPPHELALARGEQAAALASVFDAEGMEVEALAELRFSVGVPASEAIVASGSLYDTDERVVDEGGALAAARAQNPSIQLAVARAEQAASEAQLTSATLGHNLSLGATFVREGTGDRVLLGFVGFPIPLFDPSGFEVARQRATQKTAESQVDLMRAQAGRDIRLALHDRHHWREVRDTLRDGALSSFSEAFRAAKIQYEAGTVEIETVILARQRLLGVQEQLAAAAARVRQADIAVARATGSLLDEAK